jgi:pSer/pThr/pTyr-binding forkhead associated (FHA) protein
LEEWREWTTSTLDFPRWFIAGCYGGLACCVCAIAAILLYSTIWHRGTARQIILALVLCILSAAFIVGAFAWCYLRLLPNHMHLAHLEIEGMMAYVAFFGLLLPLAIACRHFFVALPRSMASSNPSLPSSQPYSTDPAHAGLHMQSSLDNFPLYQPGVQTPFVFNEETPWGWLEYRGGNFQGQRLALKRSVITIGRDEACDIWLDDDLASRFHAELLWNAGNIFFTDCGSMNGSTVNEQRVQGTILIHSDDVIGVGTHRFTFLLTAPKKESALEREDPLMLHTWRSVQDLPANSQADAKKIPFDELERADVLLDNLPSSHDVPPTSPVGVLCFYDESRNRIRFVINQPIMMIGRDSSCQIVLPDPSIAPHHARLLKQEGRDYLQDLTNAAATRINRALPQPIQLLQAGDQITLGDVLMTYELSSSAQEHDSTTSPIAPTSRTMNTPTPLKLPSRPRLS